ncbi:S-phase kinase-associated protein 2 [Halotydeus destructor]|nr:S-phase kinase-associated protein 2 [Halotydeus destructor]
MAMCTTEEGEMFKEPLSGSMKELNIGWMVNFIAANIVDKLPSGLQRLNISGNLEDNFTDSTVAKIVLRCPKLIELDISDCMKLTDKSLYAITRRLKALKTLSISRNYMMADFSTIKMIPSLESLNIYGLDEDTLVLPSYSNLAVNESAMSTVARPSAHGFRNSIWGVRLK